MNIFGLALLPGELYFPLWFQIYPNSFSSVSRTTCSNAKFNMIELPRWNSHVWKEIHFPNHYFRILPVTLGKKTKTTHKLNSMVFSQWMMFKDVSNMVMFMLAYQRGILFSTKQIKLGRNEVRPRFQRLTIPWDTEIHKEKTWQNSIDLGKHGGLGISFTNWMTCYMFSNQTCVSSMSWIRLSQ